MDYAAQAIMVESTIAASGRAITITASNSTATDAQKPWRGVTAPFNAGTPGTSVSAYAVFLDYTTREIDGDSIRRGDKRCLVAANGLADLSQYEGIVDGGEVWKIVSAETLAPGAVRLLYTFQVRK